MDPPFFPKSVTNKSSIPTDNPNDELEAFNDEIDVIKSGCWITSNGGFGDKTNLKGYWILLSSFSTIIQIYFYVLMIKNNL